MFMKIDREVIKRWVKQNPAQPLIQYLRDAEKNYALSFVIDFKQNHLNDSIDILDFASEINVTYMLTNLGNVTRCDITKESSEYAKELLKNYQCNNIVVDINNMNFDTAKQYDVIISIGPFDWNFLSPKEALEKFEKILKPNGIIIFSVPTIISPYCSIDSILKFRYFTKEKLMKLIDSSNYFIDDVALIVQPSIYFYRLPKIFQKIIARNSWEKSMKITMKKEYEKASYIVVKLQKKDEND